MDATRADLGAGTLAPDRRWSPRDGEHLAADPLPTRETCGLYLHIPWCRSICSYCDFDRQAHAFELIPAYVEALLTEIRRQPAVAVHSIFFGGGTPSMLTLEQLDITLRACNEHFRV